MSILSRFREWRRSRALKYLNSNGTRLTVRPRHTWIPHWLAGDYTMRNSELIFAAVSRVSNALSAMPVQLYKGSKPVYDDLNFMISHEPNYMMTSCQFFKTMEACRGTAGDCYALKIRTGDQTRLEILDPMKVRPIINADTGQLWWRISPDTGKEMYVHDWYMVHVPFISTNGIGGISPVSVLFDTLKYSESIQKFNVEQLEHGVNSAVVLEAPANLGPDQKEAMIEDFMKTYRDTSGNILLVESGVTAKTLTMSPVDSMLFEVEKITRSKVAMVYNIPPFLLGDYDNGSLSSQEQIMLNFLTLTMLPIVTSYEQELNRKLLLPEQINKGLHFKFDMDAILRADAATQAEVDYKAVRSGWKTVDEIRYTRNLQPIPGGIGKQALVSQDLAPLEYTVRDKPKVLMSKLNSQSQSQSIPQSQTQPAADGS